MVVAQIGGTATLPCVVRKFNSGVVSNLDFIFTLNLNHNYITETLEFETINGKLYYSETDSMNKIQN